MEKKEYIIDAKGKRIGRVATEAASVLIGKDSTSFAKNVVAPVTVSVINASQLDISEKRGKDEFQRYTGYPGGRRVETIDHLVKRRGYGVMLTRVVSGMLPKNKLQKLRLQNLKVTE